jgi:hypothetical protein
MVGTLKSKTFVKLMDWQAQQAQPEWQAAGKLMAIVWDNASVHEVDLADALISGIENRAKQGGYVAERFKFN